MRYISIILAASIALVACLGCAGREAGSPVTPSQVQASISPSDSHYLWALWQFTADPAKGTLDVVPMRTSAMHVNVVPFLEPPAGLRLKISNLHFDGALCDVDVSLVHPFPGLDQYTGFDVCGIFISSGSITGFADPNIFMSGPGDTQLLNPDGYTRWWNPVEFSGPGQPIMRYKDGLLGTNYSTAGYNCTVNGYKLFADGLDSDADIHDLGPVNRNTFSAGQSRTRHYTIDFSYGVTFNYAVDANWEQPAGGPPYTPDTFSELANRPEAWAISVSEIENTLWNDGGGSGGNLSLLIDVWDHQDGAMNTVWVDSPGNFSKASSSTPVGSGPGYSTFQVNIVSATPKPDWINMLIGIESDAVGYWDVLPDDHVTAYFTHTSLVSGGTPPIVVTSPNGGEEWEGNTNHDITWAAPPSIKFVDISYSKDNFVSDIHTIVNNTANDGLFQWKVANDPSTTVKVMIAKSGGGPSDTSDNFFTILKGPCDFGPTGWSTHTRYVLNNEVFGVGGIVLTRQDPVQRIITQSSSLVDSIHTILVYDASNPTGGKVGAYDTGDQIYTNSSTGVYVDSYSEPGIDRVFYTGGAGVAQTFNYVDWNGTDFVNQTVLVKPDTYGIWDMCFTPDGDIYMFTSYGVSPAFYFYDKSAGYSRNYLFNLPPGAFNFASVGNFRKIVWDPALGTVLILVGNNAVSNGQQLYAMTPSGSVIFSDLDVFGTQNAFPTILAPGMKMDLDDPDCRLVVYGVNSSERYFIRYSGDLKVKKVYEDAWSDPDTYGQQYGFCRGDLQDDGTLWATIAYPLWYTVFYKFPPPPDW
jgi:hypothetical protein